MELKLFKTVLAPVAALGVVLAACDQVVEDNTLELSIEEIVSNFAKIAFEREFQEDGVDHIQKWKSPIYLSARGSTSDENRAVLKEHMEQVARLTDLLFLPRLNPEVEPDNLTMFFLSDAEAREYMASVPADDPLGEREAIEIAFFSDSVKAGDPRCVGAYAWNEAGEIIIGSVFFHRDNSAAQFRTCVVEELSQVVGLPNDSSDAGPTIFNDDQAFLELTLQDRLFLRILYDERIKPGMPKDEALQQARVILRDLRRGAQLSSIGSEDGGVPAN